MRGAAEGLGFEAEDSRPKLVIPCRRIGLVYNGCIALRPRPVYIRVQDLGGKAPWDTYGNLRYVYL